MMLRVNVLACTVHHELATVEAGAFQEPELDRLAGEAGKAFRIILVDL